MAARQSGESLPLPADLDARRLDREVREQLRPLARGVAEQVSARLVATGELLDDDPEAALAHALIARRLASRIPAVREAAGLAAYRAGQWQTAIGELRAYHRMAGNQSHIAVLADCERALGRPERAVDLYRAADREQLSPAEAVELLIVAAGARADLGQRDAAVAMLQVRELTSKEPWVARLRYAYADALLAVGRGEEAREWFASAAEADEDAETDAAERLLDLDGVTLEDAVDEYDDEYAEEDEYGEEIESEQPADADLGEDLDDEEIDQDEIDHQDGGRDEFDEVEDDGFADEDDEDGFDEDDETEGETEKDEHEDEDDEDEDDDDEDRDEDDDQGGGDREDEQSTVTGAPDPADPAPR